MTPQDARVDWMHDAALFAAECLVRLPPDAPLDPRAPYEPDRAAWATRAAAAPAGDVSEWLMAAILAAERHPGAAAAFSILAEDERLMLPTPASFARIAAAGLGLGYDTALAAALGGRTGQ